MSPAGVPVPGNAWDVLNGATPAPLPRISVIVAHYEQQAQLDRTLAALARQTYPDELVEVIVVDDGSMEVPRVPAGVILVGQEDRGFRLAAARNLGARHSSGSVLCFLDADTSPERGYLAELSRLPALAPESVTVGRRRHADFTGVSPDEPIEAAAVRHPLDEPAWLTTAYERNRDLLLADDRSYRYMIGAVIACSKWFFDEIGGFDETFDSYGGEDWEWAYRAWLSGAVFAHVPTAVAWHDGPDRAARGSSTGDDVAAKNAETLALVDRIPVPGSSGRAVLSWRADLVVTLATTGPPASVFATVDSLLMALPRATVIVDDSDAALFAADPRVIGATEVRTAANVARCALSRIEIEIVTLAVFDDAAVRALVTRFDQTPAGTWRVTNGLQTLMTIEHRRARVRRDRWSRDDLFETATVTFVDAIVLDEHSSLAAYLGGWGR